MLSNDILNLILSDFASRGAVFKINIKNECKMYAMDALEFDEYLKLCEAYGYIKAVRCLGGLVHIYASQKLLDTFNS